MTSFMADIKKIKSVLFKLDSHNHSKLHKCPIVK